MSIGMLNESEQVLLLIPYGPWDLHKTSYSEIEKIMLYFEGNLVEKKDRVRIIISDIGSRKRMEREAVTSNLDTTLIEKIYHQE